MTAPQPEPEPVDIDGEPGAAAAGCDAEPSSTATLAVLPLPIDTGSRLARSVRILVPAVAGPVLVSYAAAALVLALVTVTAGAGFALAGTLRTTAAVWPAIHQVPFSIASGGSTATLGVLPLLPTLALVALVARSAGWAVRRLNWGSIGELGRLAVAFAAAHGALGMAAAIAGPAGAITTSPVHALFGCAAVAALAAALGGVLATGPMRVASALAPGWAERGMLAGLTGIATLLATGAVTTFCWLLLSASTVHDLVAGWRPGPGDGLGLTLLSIGYLPNAAVASVAWITGPGFSVGAVSVGPFTATAGEVPAVPLLAALPESGAAPWPVLVLALPVVAGVLVGQRCRTAAAKLTERLHAVVLAGAVVAAGCFVLALVAGGRLGGGAFDPVRIPPASFAVAAFTWVVLPASVLVALADLRPRRGVRAARRASRRQGRQPDELHAGQADAKYVNLELVATDTDEPDRGDTESARR